jgi:hypothetical protein
MTSEIRNPYVVLTVKCAGPVCSNVRGQANHWFVTSVEDGVYICRSFSAQISLRENEEPVCGQACAQKLFERYLAKGAERKL